MSGMTTAAHAAEYTPLDGNLLAPSLHVRDALPALTMEGLEAALIELAAAFGQLWSKRLERAVSLPKVTLDATQLQIFFANGLTPRERAIAATVDGAAAVESELRRQVDALYPWMADSVERLLHCFVAESHLAVDFDSGDVYCLVTLRDLPRIQQN